MSKLWARILLAVCSVGLGFAALYAGRLAVADYWFRQETATATEKAIELSPNQSEYRVRLALLVGDEHPSVAVAALRRAIELNPSDGRAWVELGLRLEESGDAAGGESALLHAADVDKTYLPRWTLANFYLRRNDPDHFWKWAAAALTMIYGDPRPLFHLCGRIQEDGQLIERLDVRNPQLQAAYLSYLLDEGRADLVASPVRDLLRTERAEDTPLLLTACDRLIEARRADNAAAIWSGLARLGRLPFGQLEDFPGSVINGDFRVSPTSRGFDWRLPNVEGVSAAREDGDFGLRLTFSGNQQEQTEPLIQFVPVQEKSAYELKFSYRTAGVGANSGLTWRVSDVGGAVIKQGGDLSSDDPREDRLAFTTLADCRMVRLSLICERRPGSTRVAGYIALRSVALARAAAR